jgi:hypothetical protein
LMPLFSSDVFRKVGVLSAELDALA